MITETLHSQQRAKWQIELAHAISRPEELLRSLDLPLDVFGQAGALLTRFPLRVPRGFVARMRKGDPEDPLLRQVFPLASEATATHDYSLDPVADLGAQVRPGVLHKYQGRALFIVTGGCAIHCRYCFRQHFPYASANASLDRWHGALDYLRHDPSITEIILSGGDPLAVTDQRLAALVAELDRIPHLQRLRIHTRMPIVVPERIDDKLLRWLGATRLRTVIVVHANHGAEIDEKVTSAMQRLRAIGAILLNQSVLLRGVNDTLPALVDLSERLVAVGILPYYLHLLDRVQGAARYDIPRAHALKLMEELRSSLPGYLVPRFVREQPGVPYKVPIELLEDLQASRCAIRAWDSGI
ncbi:MAG: EF-P beta-lysylation protein EpmB [Gammaproteobacteria bacterium]